MVKVRGGVDSCTPWGQRKRQEVPKTIPKRTPLPSNKPRDSPGSRGVGMTQSSRVPAVKLVNVLCRKQRVFTPQPVSLMVDGYACSRDYKVYLLRITGPRVPA